MCFACSVKTCFGQVVLYLGLNVPNDHEHGIERGHTDEGVHHTADKDEPLCPVVQRTVVVDDDCELTVEVDAKLQREGYCG